MAIELNGIGSSAGPRVRGGDQAGTKDAAKTVDAGQQSVADHVELSSQAQHLYKSDEEGTFDQARVEALKKQLAEGRYEMDFGRLADKLQGLESRL